jgi:hypothetical protein
MDLAGAAPSAGPRPRPLCAKQPCLVRGRSLSDARHLRFAQGRALGRKVSDEFVAPPVEATIAKSTAMAMKGHCGGQPGSTRRQRVARCGSNPTHFLLLRRLLQIPQQTTPRIRFKS